MEETVNTDVETQAEAAIRENETTEETVQKKALLSRKGIICIAAAAALLIGALLWVFFSGRNRFEKDAMVCGYPCGGLDAEEFAALLSGDLSRRRVILTDRQGYEIASLPLFELIGEVDTAAISKSLLSRRGSERTLSFPMESEELVPRLTELLFTGDYVPRESTDARIVSDEDGVHIAEEDCGAYRDAEATAAELAELLSGDYLLLGGDYSLAAEYPFEPSVRADDGLLNTRLESIRAFTDLEVTLEFLRGVTYTLSPGEIYDALLITETDDGAEVSPDGDKLGALLDVIVEMLGMDGVEAKYGGCAETRRYLYLKPADPGFVLDRAALLADTTLALLNGGGQVQAKYDYTQFLWKNYGWYGDLNNVLEVSIDNQYIWFYRDGQLLTESPVVTGNLSTNSITRQGVFQIYGMVTDCYLKGPTWNDHVDYWMPFDGDIGIHDSSWREEYGGDIYLEEGSHGCVNTPLEPMSIIYNNAFYGMLVIVRS